MASSAGIPLLVFTLATFVKILLIPAYRSTDFEVHRNWLAITHSLPISRWYYEDTSEWTLDYPPLFAWFEYLLSFFAALVDPAIVKLHNLNYEAHSCVLFQRFSVIVSDLTLLYAVQQYCRHQERQSCDTSLASRKTIVLSVLLLLNYGLTIVDHIHFQYNGFLFGILLLSVTRILQGRCLEGAVLFAALLNFKHIFLYIAPAYFVYLLKHYCFHGDRPESECQAGRSVPKSLRSFSPANFLKLGVWVASIFVLSFGPFIYMGQLHQVLSRLFPFKRGLCHAYWAPNFWALYNVVDKTLAVVGSRLGLLSPGSAGSMTSGLVGEMQHQALPSIPPLVTIVTTLGAMLPALLRLWLRPSRPVDFLKTLVLCAYASFLFGWHVHEKAIMMITLPMCLLAVESKHNTRIFLLLSTTGHISLLPLLFKPTETTVKVSLFILYTVAAFVALPALNVRDQLLLSPSEENSANPQEKPFESDLTPTLQCTGLTKLETGYLVLLLMVQIYCLFVHGTGGLLAHLEFLPLLLTSVTCAIGVFWTWILCYHEYLTGLEPS